MLWSSFCLRVVVSFPSLSSSSGFTTAFFLLIAVDRVMFYDVVRHKGQAPAGNPKIFTTARAAWASAHNLTARFIALSSASFSARS